MTRDELILRTRQLIAEGERLGAAPSLTALQTWLQLSDDLLATAWGTMDRYHLAWLMVGKPKGTVRGRSMSAVEEAAYVREVAGQKSAALRMSLDAVERQGMPFRGETGGIGRGLGMGVVPGAADAGDAAAGADDASARADGAETGRAGDSDDGPARPDDGPARPETGRAGDSDDGSGTVDGPVAIAHAHLARGSNRSIPLDPELQARLDEVRRAAAEHAGHAVTGAAGPGATRRAPRPERLQH